MKASMPNFVTRSLKFINQKKWWLIAIAVVLLIGLFMYRGAEAKKPKLVFGSPVRQDITQILEASGAVNAKEKASLRFAAGGKLTYLGAKEGDVVKKWQTIATIDARDLQKRLEKGLNLYSQERNDWDQTLDNTKDRALPKAEERSVNNEQLTLKNTVIDVELASIATSNTVMSTPIAGVLVSAPTSVAGVVLAATDSFLVVNPATLIFRAEVDEADIAKIMKGQAATIQLDSYPDRDIETVVSNISYSAIETSSGTAFIVELPIPTSTLNSLDTYRLGMNGSVKIKLAAKTQVLTVPLAATKERDGKFFVEVKGENDTAVEREIGVGLETDELVEVTNGLSETDQIVLPQ
jgi:RND family efflux transporter MFP subunit